MQGCLHVQLCSNTLRLRRPPLSLHRLTPLTRCQSGRGAQASFQGEPQDQQSASFRDNAQEKAQEVSKEASKRYKLEQNVLLCVLLEHGAATFPVLV